MTMLEVLTLLTLKHFIVDFWIQTPFMYLNKGNIRHVGGYVHAGLHAVATFGIIYRFPYAIEICLLEMLIHYTMDWSKVNINLKMKWGPTTHEQYWVLLGFDQFVHSMTYVLILFLIGGNK